MTHKHFAKITVMFSLLVFVVLTITMMLVGAFAAILVHFGFMDSRNWVLPVVAIALVSILVGTLLSRTIGRRPIRTIVEISEATKEVAKGNFTVSLNENIRASELQTMARNFNRMIKELAGVELFRKDFIENVSHEFKTPLSAIEGYAMLLQKKGLPEEKRAEYTDRILFNTKRLSALTGNILLLSRLENQEISITKAPYALDEQLRETVLLFESQWSAKNLEFDIELASAEYCGNQELLAQVWQNLLGNAIKFVEKNGRIRVLLLRKENSLEVSVVDNGIGMSQEVVRRVYEKFYQGDRSRASTGNGLGLTLAKRIVDLHGGDIAVSSKEGKGTAFTVTLPMAGK